MKSKKIFRELYLYLAMKWYWPMLIIPNINIKATQTMIRALYKGLVRKVIINYSYPMDIFPDVVSTILKQARKGRRKLDILICGRIEEREIEKIIYSFQIYYKTLLSERKTEYVPKCNQFKFINGIEVEEFIEKTDMEHYILSNYKKVY